MAEAQAHKILHFVPTIGRLSGGLAPVALGLAYEQQRLGLQTQIWSLDTYAEIEWAKNIYQELAPNVNIFPVLGPRSIGYSPLLEKSMLGPQGRFFDLLHQHSIWMASSRATNRWRQAFQRPTVITLHGTLEANVLRRSAWKKWLGGMVYEYRNLRAASCLHALSENEAASFRRFDLINPIAIIPNGVSETWVASRRDARQFRERLQISFDQRILLFLSRIHPKKGLPYLIEAASQLSDQLGGWQILIAGPDDNGHRRGMEILAAKRGIENLIKFIGPVFGDEKANVFASSDLFILPSQSEGFPVAVLEALGAGVPVITTRGTPWGELRDEHCGWWVDASVNGIRDALREAIYLPRTELREMGVRGRNLVARKYTWPRIAERTTALYSWLLGTGKQPDFVVVD